jgi:hypothetical protein
MLRLCLFFFFLPIAQGQPAADDPAGTLERLPQIKNEIEKDRVLRQGFEAALEQNPDLAQRYLPLVIDKPWLAEMDFRRTCALARATADAAVAQTLVLAVGLHNPELALRESGHPSCSSDSSSPRPIRPWAWPPAPVKPRSPSGN